MVMSQRVSFGGDAARQIAVGRHERGGGAFGLQRLAQDERNGAALPAPGCGASTRDKSFEALRERARAAFGDGAPGIRRGRRAQRLAQQRRARRCAGHSSRAHVARATSEARQQVPSGHIADGRDRARPSSPRRVRGPAPAARWRLAASARWRRGGAPWRECCRWCRRRSTGPAADRVHSLSASAASRRLRRAAGSSALSAARMPGHCSRRMTRKSRTSVQCSASAAGARSSRRERSPPCVSASSRKCPSAHASWAACAKFNVRLALAAGFVPAPHQHRQQQSSAHRRRSQAAATGLRRRDRTGRRLRRHRPAGAVAAGGPRRPGFARRSRPACARRAASAGRWWRRPAPADRLAQPFDQPARKRFREGPVGGDGVDGHPVRRARDRRGRLPRPSRASAVPTCIHTPSRRMP